MRNYNAFLSAFAALLLLSPPARAQLLDTLLPPAIPGYGQKFSVIAQHRDFAPGATGWNFGTISAAPGLALQTGYDSAPGGAAGSALLQANPSLLLTDQAAGFGLYAQAVTSAYPQNAAQNTATVLAAAGESIVLPRETITTSAAFLHGAATDFAFDTTAITRPILFTLQNVRASDDISSGFFTLTPEFSFSRYRFSGASTAASRNELREAATLDYAPGGPVDLIMRMSATQQDYRLSPLNADIYEYLTGAQDTEDGLWTISLLAGAAQRKPRFGPGLIAPVLEVRTDWMPTDLDQITITATREIADPDAISAAPYTQTSIKLAVSHDYLENVTFKLLADFANAQYIHANLREYLASGEVDMQWRATPALAVTGAYRFNTRQANTIGAANEHVVTLGLSWTP